MFNKKFKNRFYFFTCILPEYLAHDMTKGFWKNSYFENMRAGFLRVVKIHFGGIALKWCILMHEKKKNVFDELYVVAFDQIKI